ATKLLAALPVPIGWPRTIPGPGGVGMVRDTSAWTAQIVGQATLGWPILGWLLTAVAATMGAPFWFDLLNKVMVIRSTVKPHEKSPEESSEDRQTSKDKKLD